MGHLGQTHERVHDRLGVLGGHHDVDVGDRVPHAADAAGKAERLHAGDVPEGLDHGLGMGEHCTERLPPALLPPPLDPLQDVLLGLRPHPRKVPHFAGPGGLL